MAVPAEIQQAAENSRKMIEELAKAKKGNPEPEKGTAPENQDDAALNQDAATAQDVTPKSGDTSKADEAGSEPQKEPPEPGDRKSLV